MVQNSAQLLELLHAINRYWHARHLNGLPLLNWHSESRRQLPGKGSQRVIKIFVMHDDVLGKSELYGSEVPDGLDAPLHHFIGDRLRHFGRCRDDPQMDAHPRSKITQLVERQNRLLMDPLTDLCRVGVESSHNPQTELRESLVAEKRRTQISRAHKKRFVDVVPAKKRLDGENEFGDRIAGLRLADDSRVLQVFAHLHRDAA